MIKEDAKDESPLVIAQSPDYHDTALVPDFQFKAAKNASFFDVVLVRD